MRIAFLSLALMCAPMAACGTQQQPEEAADTETNESEEPVTSPAAEPQGLVLSIDGLNLGNGEELSFGTPREAAIAFVEPIAGERTQSDSDRLCGAGPMEFSHFGALTLNYQEDLLVGWHLGGEGANADLATPGGLAIGATREEIEAAPNPVFEQTSIGQEFTADGVDGLLGEDGVVSALWAGTNCVYR